MNRRNFVKGCLAACGAGLAISMLPGCKTAFYVSSQVKNKVITVKKADMAEHKSAIIRNDQLQAPVYLLQREDGSWSAVLMLCTHKGCELNVAGSFLVCPCHGSEFENTGKVLTAPADRDLASYTVTSDNENLYIQL